MRYKIGGKSLLLCQRRKIHSSGKACVVVGCFAWVQRKQVTSVTWQKGIIRRRGEAYDHRADSWLSESRDLLPRFSVLLLVMLSLQIVQPTMGLTGLYLVVLSPHFVWPRFQILSSSFSGWMGGPKRPKSKQLEKLLQHS